jgi:hypothetical protein
MSYKFDIICKIGSKDFVRVTRLAKELELEGRGPPPPHITQPLRQPHPLPEDDIRLFPSGSGATGWRPHHHSCDISQACPHLAGPTPLGARIRTITFSKIARTFSTHTFSIFARMFSIPCVPDRSGLFPALLQYRAAWSAHMNLKIKMCSWLTLRSSSRPVYTRHVPRWWVDLFDKVNDDFFYSNLHLMTHYCGWNCDGQYTTRELFWETDGYY